MTSGSASDFWAGKRVLLTGHTGFKGAWAGRWLARRGAAVTGLALAPEPGPNLSTLLGEDHLAASHLVDLRDAAAVDAAVAQAQPDLVLHMAAQPLVRRSYAEPVATFATNVMGTLHLLDALQRLARPRAVLVITSDKVYENDGSGRAYEEGDRLGGHDPYSASKAATEIAVASWRQSFCTEAGPRLMTARGGNVIGGGDWSEDRLIPDIIRALAADEVPVLRNPTSTRPWQHVLECLDGYLTLLEAMTGDAPLPDALNFGPAEGAEPVAVGVLTNRLLSAMGRPTAFAQDSQTGPHEMALLGINSALAQKVLGWTPRLDAARTIGLTADWYAAWAEGQDVTALTDHQIALYEDIRP
ncbi:CDP-glucose 4,6-dehydratase [Gemmobacter sp. 24YEA27]|uniref:CDP-glucose 4,6-dehydratase n=1 Tax=Gemmobacter sp. 24YEA27 TaxID=3040672 RepID=UPI0024B3946F|nr:CDP-glucose 4,6-dehydratase [Gemmobacter sp. 24YEA27]